MEITDQDVPIFQQTGSDSPELLTSSATNTFGTTYTESTHTPQEFVLKLQGDSSTDTAPTHDREPSAYYDLTFDNVNQKIGVRNHMRGKSNVQLNMVQTYATLDRTDSYGLSDKIPSASDVKKIGLSSLLPTPNDVEKLKSELGVMYSRIVTTYIPAFKGLKTEWSIPHKYSAESALKSHVTPLGILNFDETTRTGMIGILDEYRKYVAKNKDGTPVTTVVHGDGLSCERLDGAKRARLNGEVVWSRLSMFEPNTHEWHRRAMFVQDTFDQLFSFDSHREKGTLYYIKQKFDHKSVGSNVIVNFDRCEDFLNFATAGYAVSAFMQKSAMGLIDDTPNNFPDNDDKIKFRDQIICEIIADIFPSYNISELINVVVEDADSKDIAKGDECICKLDLGGVMVYCNNNACPRGSWFHIDCIGLKEEDIPENDWYCSDTCKKGYEISKKKKKQTINKFKDGKMEYAFSLSWRGLNNIARHDAVKENDGPRMILHWKFNLFDFSEYRHPKYMLYAVRLLANISGAASDRIAHNLTWERTVNSKGGKRKNVPKDLHCEHFNNEYKDNIRKAGGSLTENTIARYSHMLGIGKLIERSFTHGIIPKGKFSKSRKEVNRSKDVKKLVKILHSENLLNCKKWRAFAGFEDHRVSSGVKDPRKFKKYVNRHLSRLVVYREMQMLELK